LISNTELSATVVPSKKVDSVKKRNISATTLPGKIILLPEKKQTALPIEQSISTKQNALPEEQNEVVLLQESVTKSAEEKQTALPLPEEQKEAVLLQESVTKSAEEKRTNLPIEQSISTKQNALPEEQKEAVLLQESVTKSAEEKQTNLPTESTTYIKPDILQNTLPEEEIQTTLLDETTLLPKKKQTTFPNNNSALPKKRIALPILPQFITNETPTWENIKYMFENVHQIVMTKGESILKTSLKAMTSLHFQVLELLGVPFSVYNNLEGPWWRFQKG